MGNLRFHKYMLKISFIFQEQLKHIQRESIFDEPCIAAKNYRNQWHQKHYISADLVMSHTIKRQW